MGRTLQAAGVTAVIAVVVMAASFGIVYAIHQSDRETTACRDGFVYLREGVCVEGYRP